MDVFSKPCIADGFSLLLVLEIRRTIVAHACHFSLFIDIQLMMSLSLSCIQLVEGQTSSIDDTPVHNIGTERQHSKVDYIV